MVKKNDDFLIEYTEKIIEIENDKEKNINKNCRTLMILNSLLLVSLIISFIELLNIDSIRLFTIIFGFTIIGLIISSLVFALFGLILNKSKIDLSNKDSIVKNLDMLYLEKRKNNRSKNKLLFLSFIINCTSYLVLISAVIVIMILI